MNSQIRYKIANKASVGGLFEVDPKLGYLTLARRLDYETFQRHNLIITATDTGNPPLSANLTVLVEVQDVNDNPPVFEQAEYKVNVLETLSVNTQVSNIYIYIIICVCRYIINLYIQKKWMVHSPLYLLTKRNSVASKNLPWNYIETVRI